MAKCCKLLTGVRPADINEMLPAAYSSWYCINEVLPAAYRCPSSCYQRSAASCLQVPVQLLSTKCCKLVTGARPVAINEVLPAAYKCPSSCYQRSAASCLAYRCPSSCYQRSAASCLYGICLMQGELRGCLLGLFWHPSPPPPPPPRQNGWLAHGFV